MDTKEQIRYTFGDSDVAAERLLKIAEFFHPYSARFVKNYCPSHISTIVDLGCGPGFTTDMLAKATKAKKVLGLDLSEKFIQDAKNLFPNYNFLRHDITEIPFPVKADVMYCKFLLSHLNNLEELIINWLNQLNPNGFLLFDELEDVITDIPVFKQYLEVSDRLVQSQGAKLYVGKEFHGVIKKFNVICNQTETIPVNNGLAAGWFYPNTVSVWNSEKIVHKFIPAIERQRISDLLLQISLGQDIPGNLTWKMKRIVIKK